MAKIGLLHPCYAPIITEPENAPIVYGEGKIFAKAISAGVTFTASDNPLYGDDAIIEDDNGITSAEVTMGVDDIDEEDMVALLGAVKTGEEGAEEYQDSGESAPYVGCGYLQVRKKDGVTSWIGNWWHKVQFNRPDETTNTKGANIEWQTDTIDGTAMGVRIDKSGRTYFRARKPFTSYEQALAWLKAKANITEEVGE